MLGQGYMTTYAPHADTVELDSGHWAQLEASAEYNAALERWVGKRVVPAARL